MASVTRSTIGYVHIAPLSLVAMIRIDVGFEPPGKYSISFVEGY